MSEFFNAAANRMIHPVSSLVENKWKRSNQFSINSAREYCRQIDDLLRYRTEVPSKEANELLEAGYAACTSLIGAIKRSPEKELGYGTMPSKKALVRWEAAVKQFQANN